LPENLSALKVFLVDGKARDSCCDDAYELCRAFEPFTVLGSEKAELAWLKLDSGLLPSSTTSDTGRENKRESPLVSIEIGASDRLGMARPDMPLEWRDPLREERPE
jgi:hypothetical protein